MASQVTHRGKTADAVYIINSSEIASGGPTVISLGTFQALTSGTGYSAGDVILYQQEPPALPVYINTATGAEITPDGNDLGPVGGVSSSVTVSNFPTSQEVTGTVSVDNHPTSIEVSNFPTSHEVEGTVSIDNFPTTQAVSGTVAVSNHPTSVQVSNFPTTQPVSGSVNVGNLPATQSVTGTVNIGNLPATQEIWGAVEVSNFPSNQEVSGTVSVSNFPATQPVSGTIAVSNHPTAFQVSNFPSTQPVSGTVNVGNLPATQTVAGTVAVSNHPTTFQVSNFPTTQAVSGSVSVTNFPVNQTISGTVEVSNLSATQTQYTEGDTDATITGTAILWEKAGDVLSPVSAANPLPVTGSLSVSNTVALAVFKTLASGTGYSTGNIIVLRQTPPAAPEYYNATTNAVIAAPAPADLGPIASSSNVIIDSGAVTANAGTNLNTSLLALEGGGNLAAIATALAGTLDVDGSVTVSNFPTTQAVSGTVAVSNHPTAIQVSNLPATQAVSGTVAVSNHPTSIQVSNLPTTQPVSGTVTVSNQPTSIQVSNFPTTQAVSGTVAINNHPTSIEVSNLPATQAVSGTVAVSNQPTSIEVSNLPTTQPVSGSVTVSNLPTTQAISGTITANAGSNLNTSALALESGGNLAAIATALAGTVDVAGAVTVSNFPGSFDVSNFPATQAVSGTITANAGTNLNTSALALESGGNLATIATNTVAGTAITGATIPTGGVGRIGWLSAIWQQVSTKLPALSSGRVPVEVAALPTGSNSIGSVSVSNFPATQPVSGTITANAGTNLNTSALALESGGNLATISANTAPGTKITAATIPAGGSGPIGWLSAIWADVVGIAGKLPALSGGKIPVEVAGATVTGTVAVSNQPTSIQVSNFPATQPVSGTVTANAGTNLNTSLLALESGGNLATISTNTAQGAAITGATMPTGGVGRLGWLSATWVQATALLASVGAPADAAATSDSGTFSLVSLIKRSLLRLSNIYAVLCTGTRSGGAPADNAVISGTITAPPAGQYIHFTGYSFSFSANPSAARALTITAGGATLADIDVTTGGAGPVSISVSAPANTAVTFSLAASGTAGNIGKLSLYHTTLSVI
jgi:hypothetical protein